MQQKKVASFIKNRPRTPVYISALFLMTIYSSYTMDRPINLERIRSIVGPRGSLVSMLPEIGTFKRPIGYFGAKIEQMREKIPDQMKTAHYWINSFINGRKTNGALAILATGLYPLGSQKAILLQSAFLAKNIICMRLFSNNFKSDYCTIPCEPAYQGDQNPFANDSNFLNRLIGPYSAVLLIISIAWAGCKTIAQFVNRSTIIHNSIPKTLLTWLARFVV